MIRIFVCLLCIGFLPSLNVIHAQNYVTKKEVTGGAKKAFDKGMTAFRAGNNEDAIKEFNKAIKSKENFIDAIIQRAAAHYDNEQFSEAELGFESAHALSPTYRTMVIYTLAKTEMILEKFPEAIAHFEEYKTLESKKVVLLEKADRYIQECKFMSQALTNAVPFEPVKLSLNINTEEAEYLPALTADQETMVFTRRVRGQEDIYISKKMGDDWSLARPLTDINTRANEAAQSISANGKFIVFTACNRPDGIGGCDLYFSEVINGRWTNAKNIGAPINTKGWESQPSISADGRTLYFVKASDGASRSRDIYYSIRKQDGSWTTPENVGPNINTKDSDQSPFIHPDGSTLYFMSDGWPGMGKHDLFYSRMDDNGVWSPAINLGYPINTASSESALIVSFDGKTAYFASEKGNLNPTEENSTVDNLDGNPDIYQFELYEEARPQPVTYVRAKVTDSKSSKPLVAQVEFVNLNSGKIHSASITDVEGDFLVCLPLGKNYSLNVNKEKYIFHSENFALTDKNRDQPFFLDIALRKIPDAPVASSSPTPLPMSAPIILKNVFFDTGSANLRSESFSELGKLKQLLLDYPTMEIEISGHTDNVGTDDANQKLSEDRAHAVYDYLIGHGIQKTRLAYKGFGESQPIGTNETEEGRQVNRRTEFVIIKN